MISGDFFSSEPVSPALNPNFTKRSLLRVQTPKPLKYERSFIFGSHLAGAKARLFAAVCVHYIHAAEIECNDDPEIPIFRWLSPHQRVKLVREVMIGMLCEHEPLPPPTLHHYATYLALIETIRLEVQVEIEMQMEKISESALDLCTVEDLDVLLPWPPMPPDRVLSDEERYYVFPWRILLEEAVKDCNHFMLSVGFDFRARNTPTWMELIGIEFISDEIFEVHELDTYMVTFPIDRKAKYADPTKKYLIHCVTETVNDLRVAYETSWDPKLRSDDQRCVFAIGASDVFCPDNIRSEIQQKFFMGLMHKFSENHISHQTIGDYQKRLDPYNEIRKSYAEGLTSPLFSPHPQNTFFGSCQSPSEYTYLW